MLVFLTNAQIGSFEHNLTTDLLNHLVFLQKVFMKEVNEVIQKVSGTASFSFLTNLPHSPITAEPFPAPPVPLQQSAFPRGSIKLI